MINRRYNRFDVIMRCHPDNIGIIWVSNGRKARVRHAPNLISKFYVNILCYIHGRDHRNDQII